MYCEKCHTKLEKKATVCKQCGKKTNARKKSSFWGSFSYGEQLDSQYIKAYIGKNYKWFKNSFSIPGALFGPLYCLYRKQWKIGIPNMILLILINLYIPESLSTLLRLIINMIIAFSFNQLYIKDIQKSIEMIKKQNPNTTEEEINKICKKEGKPLNIMMITSIALLYFFLIVIIQNKDIIKLTQTKNTTLTNNHLTYKVPNNIIIKTNYTNYQHLIHKKENDSCYITVSNQLDSKTEKEYLMDIINNKYFDKHSHIKEIEVNEIKWHHVEITSMNQMDIYVTKKEDTNQIYELSFLSRTNYSCKEDIDIILESASWN